MSANPLPYPLNFAFHWLARLLALQILLAFILQLHAIRLYIVYVPSSTVDSARALYKNTSLDPISLHVQSCGIYPAQEIFISILAEWWTASARQIDPDLIRRQTGKYHQSGEVPLKP